MSSLRVRCHLHGSHRLYLAVPEAPCFDDLERKRHSISLRPGLQLEAWNSGEIKG